MRSNKDILVNDDFTDNSSQYHHYHIICLLVVCLYDPWPCHSLDVCQESCQEPPSHYCSSHSFQVLYVLQFFPDHPGQVSKTIFLQTPIYKMSHLHVRISSGIKKSFDHIFMTLISCSMKRSCPSSSCSIHICSVF